MYIDLASTFRDGMSSDQGNSKGIYIYCIYMNIYYIHMISYTNCILLLAENGCTLFHSRELFNKNNAKKKLDTPKIFNRHVWKELWPTKKNLQQQQVCKIVRKLLWAIQVLDELSGVPQKNDQTLRTFGLQNRWTDPTSKNFGQRQGVDPKGKKVCQLPPPPKLPGEMSQFD